MEKSCLFMVLQPSKKFGVHYFVYPVTYLLDGMFVVFSVTMLTTDVLDE